MSEISPPASGKEFLPALQGLRWFAALAVLGTHAAFQTGAGAHRWYQHVFSRLDLAVAVFFALSGFLLWRSHAEAARGVRAPLRALAYYRSRAVRIVPAYLVVAFVVLIAEPRADGRVWWANLTLTQPFAPFTLITGLTQMWSLSVEVSFYLVLPLIALAMAGLSGARAHWRAPALLAMAAISLSWAFLPWRLSPGWDEKLWLPGFLPWFAAGMVLAELRADGHVPARLRQRQNTATNRLGRLAVAALAFGLACTPLGGPADLEEVPSWQYATKVALGAVLAAALVGFASHRGAHAVLAHPITQILGKWSYSFFLWHLAVLAVMLPVLGLAPFTGRLPLVFAVTAVFAVGVSAVSYAWVEEPCARLWGSGRRDDFDGREIRSVSARVAGQQPVSANGGVGADVEVR